MQMHLDCIPCFVQQAVRAARRVSDDSVIQKRVVREALCCINTIDFSDPPPRVSQIFYRRLSEITGIPDLYQADKEKQNKIALELLPKLEKQVESTPDPLLLAARLAIAGNIIDLGANGNLTIADIHEAVDQALNEPLVGDWGKFKSAVSEARDILYLADNAGEIVFDRLLIERILPKPVTLGVRGAPAINDALRIDAQIAGLDKLVEVIDNGSDAPGTLLDDCSREFRRRFAAADLIIAKGQGNYETLCDEPQKIFFLFKIKCPVIARHIGQPVGTQVLSKSKVIQPEGRND